MKATGVAWQAFAIPFIKPYATSLGTATTRYGLLLFLSAGDGVVGVGEASPVGVGSREEIEDIAAHVGSLAPLLLGMDPTTPGAWYHHPGVPMPPVARFGIETALLDLAGKARGCSVAELLGGAPAPLPVNALIASETPQDAQAEARHAVALDFTSLKLKVGAGGIERDEELVQAVRQAIGPGVRLRIDPNQGWSPPEAIAAINRLARYGVEYVEQPVAAANIKGLRDVRLSVPVPIAADEALGSAEDFNRLVEAEAADVFVIKAGRLGGVRAAMEVMRLAQQAGKPVVATSSLESGVGLAASAHLAVMLPLHPFAHGLATGLLLESDLLSPPLLPAQGVLSVPRRPGLGVEVDEAALSRYGIGVNGAVGSW